MRVLLSIRIHAEDFEASAASSKRLVAVRQSLVHSWKWHDGPSRPSWTVYAEEFTFRFNRRTSSHRVKLFHRLAEQTVRSRAITYRELAMEVPE